MAADPRDPWFTALDELRDDLRTTSLAPAPDVRHRTTTEAARPLSPATRRTRSRCLPGTSCSTPRVRLGPCSSIRKVSTSTAR